MQVSTVPYDEVEEVGLLHHPQQLRPLLRQTPTSPVFASLEQTKPITGWTQDSTLYCLPLICWE